MSVDRIGRYAAGMALALTLLDGAAARAQRQALPGARQASILSRVLVYDENLKNRAGDAVVVAVLYRGSHHGSQAAADDIYSGFKTFESFAIRGLPFRVVRIAYTDAEHLRAAIRERGVDAVYVCAGMDDDLSAITTITRDNKILSMAGVEDFVARGLSVGVFVEESKPVIYLNKVASEAEGASFSIDFVRLARVIDGR
jgi:hypothetical protein